MRKTLFVLMSMTLTAIIFSDFLCAETIRVDSVVVSAKTLPEAETLGRTEALKRALEMMGNLEIPSDLRDQILSQADSLVTIRQALNKKKTSGIFTPVFFCDVDRSGIKTIMDSYRKPTLISMKRPQINIAIVFRTLPSAFEPEKAFFLDRVNNLLEEHFGAAGFRISTPPSVMLAKLNQKNPQEVFHTFVRYSTEVNFLLFGAMDILDADIIAKDNARYYEAKVGLTLRFFAVSSHDQISFSRDVYGIGENESASILNSMRNCAEAITEKVAAHRVIQDWEQKLNEGFEYSLMFCSFHDSNWIRDLRNALKERGTFVSKSRGDNVTKIYRYQANPMQFVFPSTEFEDFLENLDGFDKVETDVILVQDRLFFVFGDDAQCFDQGFDASETTVSISK